ncbi:MAG: hypothetical protein ACMVP2_15905 [Imperialibacter sp.]|uniref:hypothetical protein n=2 Tax=Cytophagales TaxID=768507 RepID=UPI0030D6F966|tara:strand:- start:1203 stop:1781 length:579 start_codon:yes stop_codon:yes gene_type:complete
MKLYHKNHQIMLTRCLATGLFALVLSGCFAQKYYTTEKGNVHAYFKYHDTFEGAASNEAEVIFNRDSKTIWVTIRCSALSTGNRRIDRHLFRKNGHEFVVKTVIPLTGILYDKEEVLQLSLNGRIFNKVKGESLSLSGKFDFSQAESSETFDFHLYFGIDSKWMGDRFLQHSDYPVINIQVAAKLAPVTEMK